MVELFFLVALPGHHDADRESSHEEASQPDAVLAADHVTEGSERQLNGGDGQSSNQNNFYHWKLLARGGISATRLISCFCMN